LKQIDRSQSIRCSESKEAIMSATEFTLPTIRGSRAKLRLVAALGVAAAIASCFADAAAPRAEPPARTTAARYGSAIASARDARGEARVAEAPRNERRTVIADAGERRKSTSDQPLEPCPAPSAPQFEASPQGPRDLGDFPRFPFA
jgi:hypothetical protein